MTAYPSVAIPLTENMTHTNIIFVHQQAWTISIIILGHKINYKIKTQTKFTIEATCQD